MADPDLKLAREIVARRIVSEADRMEILCGKCDQDTPLECVLEGIKAGRAAEKEEREVPDDLMEMADQVMRENWPGDRPGWSPTEATEFVEAIAAALTKARAAGVAQERERCAAIADASHADYQGKAGSRQKPYETYMHSRAIAAQEIASAIRKGGSNE